MEQTPSSVYKNQFLKNGYCVIENFLSAEETASLRNEMDNIIASIDPDSENKRICFSALRHGYYHAKEDYFVTSSDKIRHFYDTSALDKDGKLLVPKEKAVNKVGHSLHWMNPVFKKTTFSSKVQEVARTLGFEDPHVVQSMYIFKQPNFGEEVIPHQDASYLFNSPTKGIGFWLALDDATLENGCLWFWPGSQDKPIERRFVRNPNGNVTPLVYVGPEYIDVPKDQWVPAPVKKGDCIIIHGKVCTNMTLFDAFLRGSVGPDLSFFLGSGSRKDPTEEGPNKDPRPEDDASRVVSASCQFLLKFQLTSSLQALSIASRDLIVSKIQAMDFILQQAVNPVVLELHVLSELPKWSQREVYTWFLLSVETILKEQFVEKFWRRIHQEQVDPSSFPQALSGLVSEDLPSISHLLALSQSLYRALDLQGTGLLPPSAWIRRALRTALQTSCQPEYYKHIRAFLTQQIAEGEIEPTTPKGPIDIREVNGVLTSLGIWSPLMSRCCQEVFQNQIRTRVKIYCGEDLGTSYIKLLEEWLQEVRLQWIEGLSARPEFEELSSELKFLLGNSSALYEEEIQREQLGLSLFLPPKSSDPSGPSEQNEAWELFLHEELAKMRISQLFLVIIGTIQGSRIFAFVRRGKLLPMRRRKAFRLPITDFPESMPALDDLRCCLEKCGKDLQPILVMSLREAFENRLLHAGVGTDEIILAFISAIKALRHLDNSGVILSLAVEPIRKYLRNREDTIRRVILSLTDDAAGGGASDLMEELQRDQRAEAEADSSDLDPDAPLHYPPEESKLQQLDAMSTVDYCGQDLAPEIGSLVGTTGEASQEVVAVASSEGGGGQGEDIPPVSGDDEEMTNGESTTTGRRKLPKNERAWLTWNPDPWIAAQATGIMSKRHRTADMFTILINIYGSRDLFVAEYRSLLADRILGSLDCDIQKEIRQLELLKKRFGENPLVECEVMLRDVHDSKRLNGLVHREKTPPRECSDWLAILVAVAPEEAESSYVPEKVVQFPLFRVEATVLSAQFWPELKDENSIEMPK
ncbi:unnamed protein product, partial [Cyprideis torosa]